MGTIAIAVKHLIASGMSPEAIVEAISEMEEAMEKPVELTARQQRNRRYYERLKASEKRLKASETSEHPSPFPSPLSSPLNSPPTPPPIIPPTISPTHTPSRNPNAGAKKVAHRIPDEWHVGEQEFSEAIKIGLSREQIELESQKFQDYWSAKSGKDATKLDWLATWRNWCRTAAERTKPRFQSQTYEKPKTRNQLHQEAVDRELAKIIHGEDHVEFTDNVIDLAQRDYRFTA